MFTRIEDFENQFPEEDGIDEELHRNFSPEKISFPRKMPILETSDSAKAENLKNRWQGDIGEGVSIRVASERLNLTPDPRFDQPSRGFDGVFKDNESNLVVVESKFTQNGIHSLHKEQMQPEWIARTAMKMKDPDSEMYTQGNAEIAAEIQKRGAAKIRRVVIATDPRSLEAKIYEGQSDKSWKMIDSWNVLDLEQPFLK